MDNGLFDLPVIGASHSKDANTDYSRRDRNDEEFGDLISVRDNRADENASSYEADARTQEEQYDLRGDTREPRNVADEAQARGTPPQPDNPNETQQETTNSAPHSPESGAQTGQAHAAETSEAPDPQSTPTPDGEAPSAASVPASNAAPQVIAEQLAATPPPLTPALGRPTWSRDGEPSPNPTSTGPVASATAKAVNFLGAPVIENGAGNMVPPSNGIAPDASTGAEKTNSNTPTSSAANSAFSLEAAGHAAPAESFATDAKPNADIGTVPQNGVPQPQLGVDADIPPDGAIEELAALGASTGSSPSNAGLDGAPKTAASPEIANQPIAAAPIAPAAAQSTSAQTRPTSANAAASAFRNGQAVSALSASNSAAGQSANTASNPQPPGANDLMIAANAERNAMAAAPRGGDAAPDLAVFRETLATVLPDAGGTQSADAVKSAGRIVAAELTGRPQLLHPSLTDQVTIRIREAFDAGDSQVRIQLQPKELGRIDVRMEITESGRMSALVVAERPDTLEMLMRDARGLERALQQAGFQTDSNSLSFDLKNGDEQAGDLGAGTDNGGTEHAESETVPTDEITIDLAALLSGDPAAQGIDISV